MKTQEISYHSTPGKHKNKNNSIETGKKEKVVFYPLQPLPQASAAWGNQEKTQTWEGKRRMSLKSKEVPNMYFTVSLNDAECDFNYMIFEAII